MARLPARAQSASAETEVLDFVRDLIRIESVNTGEPATIGDGEAVAARYVQERLDEVGYRTTYLEPVPGRGNVVCRLQGADPGAGALLLHAHLDVVPAVASEWSVPPFSGEVVDGVLHGRGAVDMKNMAGMMLAVARSMKQDRIVPSRDLVFVFVADEEDGGNAGMTWLVDNRPDLFDGVTEAIGEGGGYSVTLPNGERVYLMGAAEKGAARLKLTARGTSGHGSLVNEDNAVTAVAEAIVKLGNHAFPIIRTPPLDACLDRLRQITGLSLDVESVDDQLTSLGIIANVLRPGLRNTANPTVIDAGIKRNVIPATATAMVDCRLLPDTREDFVRQVVDLVGTEIELEWVFGTPISSPVDSGIAALIGRSIAVADPDAHVVPFIFSGGTDNKQLSSVGIDTYGFVPLRVPPDFDVFGLFHAVDERVPVESILFGTRILNWLLRNA